MAGKVQISGIKLPTTICACHKDLTSSRQGTGDQLIRNVVIRWGL